MTSETGMKPEVNAECWRLPAGREEGLRLW